MLPVPVRIPPAVPVLMLLTPLLLTPLLLTPLLLIPAGTAPLTAVRMPSQTRLRRQSEPIPLKLSVQKRYCVPPIRMLMQNRVPSIKIKLL